MSTGSRIRWALVAAALLLVAGLVLLGLPGAVLVEAADNLLAPSGIATFKGDKAWPAAIYLTGAMPIGVVVSGLVLARLRPDAGLGASTLWGALGYVVAGIVVTILLVLVDRMNG